MVTAAGWIAYALLALMLLAVFAPPSADTPDGWEDHFSGTVITVGALLFFVGTAWIVHLFAGPPGMVGRLVLPMFAIAAIVALLRLTRGPPRQVLRRNISGLLANVAIGAFLAFGTIATYWGGLAPTSIEQASPAAQVAGRDPDPAGPDSVPANSSADVMNRADGDWLEVVIESAPVEAPIYVGLDGATPELVDTGRVTLDVQPGTDVHYEVRPPSDRGFHDALGSFQVDEASTHTIQLAEVQWANLEILAEPSDATILAATRPGDPMEVVGTGSAIVTVRQGTEVRYHVEPPADSYYSPEDGSVSVTRDSRHAVTLEQAAPAQLELVTQPVAAEIQAFVDGERVGGIGHGRLSISIPLGTELQYVVRTNDSSAYRGTEGTVTVNRGERYEIVLEQVRIDMVIRTEPVAATIRAGVDRNDLEHEGTGELSLSVMRGERVHFRAGPDQAGMFEATTGSVRASEETASTVVTLDEAPEEVEFIITTEPIAAPIYATANVVFGTPEHIGTGTGTLTVEKGSHIRYEIRPGEGSGYEPYEGTVIAKSTTSHPVWLTASRAPTIPTYSSPSGRPAPPPGQEIQASPEYVVNFVANELELTDITCPVKPTPIMVCGLTSDSESLIRNVIDSLFQTYLQPVERGIEWQYERQSGSLVGAFERTEGVYVFSISTRGAGAGVVSIGHVER